MMSRSVATFLLVSLIFPCVSLCWDSSVCVSSGGDACRSKHECAHGFTRNKCPGPASIVCCNAVAEKTNINTDGIDENAGADHENKRVTIDDGIEPIDDGYHVRRGVEDQKGTSCNSGKGHCREQSSCSHGFWRGFCPGVTYCCKPPFDGILINTHDRSEDPLAGNGGTGDNVVIVHNLKGRNEVRSVDVVVHLHGYSKLPVTEEMTMHAFEHSGVDVSSRSRPTVGIVPRGKKRPGSNRAWFHPTLQKNLDLLIDIALEEVSRKIGTGSIRLTRGRLILTGHSGGGGNLYKLVAAADPQEVYSFDATYYDTRPLDSWIRKHLAEDRQALESVSDRAQFMENHGHAIRVIFKRGTGTEKLAVRLNGIMPSKSDPLHAWFRTQNSAKSHMMIPIYYGPKLLENSACCQE